MGSADENFIYTILFSLEYFLHPIMRSINNCHANVDVHDGFQSFGRFILTFRKSTSFSISHLLLWYLLEHQPS